MQVRLWLFLAVFSLGFSLSVSAQQTDSPPSSTTSTASSPVPVRDPKAVAALQTTFTAMGSAVPSDSLATGTVIVSTGTEGEVESGTIRILTRGTDQSSEQVQSSTLSNTVIYSHGQANEIIKGNVKPVPLELAASSQSPDFPIALIAAAFNNPDVSFQYVGEETVDGSQTQHIRFWNTFASQKHAPLPPATPIGRPGGPASSVTQRQNLSEFTKKDLWVDTATGLPRKLTYERREAGGAVPKFRIEVTYSNWQSTSGIPYPYQIEKTWNGAPWTTITLQSVALQTGLKDSDFPVTAQKVVKP